MKCTWESHTKPLKPLAPESALMQARFSAIRKSQTTLNPLAQEFSFKF
jgi:hypothetical protein